jgi:probable rRNA maturation factor
MIEINNLSKSSLDKKSFSQVAKKVLSGENRESESISLAFVSKEEIRKLNKEFRRKDKPTDVLSFDLKEEGYLGEIIICPEVVKNNAKKYGVSEKSEIIKVFIHGILHLCGYDHEKNKTEEKKMDNKQNFYLAKIKIQNF